MLDIAVLLVISANVPQALILWMDMETKLEETALAEEFVIMVPVSVNALLDFSELDANTRLLYSNFYCCFKLT
jgi:hypothetical protein